MGALLKEDQLKLIEGNKADRDQYINNTGVLIKVKNLVLLPNSEYMTSEMVADYYEVDQQAIQRIFLRHRLELNGDGVKVIKGEELKQFKIDVQPVHLKAKSNLTIIPKRAILRIGMLLTESLIAEKIRTYLLNVEEQANTGQKEKAIQSTEWDSTKDELLLNTVIAFSNTGKTLGQAFDHVANITGVTKNQVHGRWYQNGVRQRCDDRTLVLIKNNMSTKKSNYKIVELPVKQINTNSTSLDDIEKLINLTLIQKISDVKEKYSQKEVDWIVKHQEVNKELKVKIMENESLKKLNEQMQHNINSLNIIIKSKDVAIEDKEKRIAKLSKELAATKKRLDVIGMFVDKFNTLKESNKGTTISKPKKSFKMDQNGNLTEVKN